VENAGVGRSVNDNEKCGIKLPVFLTISGGWVTYFRNSLEIGVVDL
jgi:hypothetical protein